jgi:hypothetical protein
MADSNKDIRDTNDLLREQLELLKQVKDLQQDSYDVSSAAVDSIKDALGINSRRSTFERDTLKVNQSIAQSILDQKTGLSSTESIGRQISKNQNLLNKAKLIETGLINSLGKKRDKDISEFIRVYKIQQSLNKQLEEGENLTKRQINSLIKKLKSNDELLDKSTQQLSSIQLQLAYTKLNTEELKKQQSLRENELGIQQKLEDQLGLVGKIAKTLGSFRGISEDVTKALSDTTKEMQRMAIEEGKVIGKWQSFSMFVGNLGKNLSKHLTDPLVVLTSFISILKDIDKGAGDFAKSMNITYSDALNVRGEMASIAASSGDVALNSKNLQESLGYINQQLGTNGKLSEKDLITFTKLREQSGLTNEQLFSMQKYTMTTGGTLEDNVATFQATSKILSYQNKVSLNTKQLMVDMGNVSNRTKLSIEGGAAGLAKASVNAKLMGGNLEKVAAIADQLLNFESSIEAELSAELLTGKDITLEKARQAALNNDLATVASEITNQIGSAAEYSKMNRIQQEAMAKAVGMNADQLADVLVEQEAIRAIGGKLSEDEQRAFETAKGRYGLEQASKMLKAGQLDQLVDQQSAQDRFNQTVEKLKDIFVSLAGPVMQIVSPFADFVGYLASSKAILSGIAGIFMGMKVFQIWSLAAKQRELTLEAEILAVKTGQAVASSVINPLAAAAGIAAGLATAALVYNSMKDGEIDPKKGPVLSGDFGSVQLNPRDKAMYGADGTIKVGTDLLKENTQTKINPYTSNTQIPTPSPSVDMSAMVNKMEQMFAKLQDRPVVVHSVVKTENNDVLATATNTSNRKTGYAIQ